MAVALLAGAWFLLGIRHAEGWRSGWVDSGLVVYESWRVAHGAVPYRDFDHVYGPALFYLNAGLFLLFGPDLEVIRGSLVVLKVLLALALYRLARDVAGVGVAALVTAVFVAVWGAPLWLFSAPYASHYGCVLALGGLVALTARRGRPAPAAFLAGLAFGGAATFKLTSGLFPFFAAVLHLLLDTTPRGSARRAVGVQAFRVGATAAVVAATAVYAGASLHSSTRPGSALATVGLLAAPFLVCALVVLRRELARSGDPTIDRGGVRRVLACAAGAAVLPLCWAVFYLAHGAAGAAVRDLLVLPQTLVWFAPLQAPAPRTILIALAVVVALVAAGRRVAGRPWAVPALAATAAAILAVLAVLRARPRRIGWTAYLTTRVFERLVYDVAYWTPVVSVVAAMPPLLGPLATARPEAPDVRRVPVLYLLFGAAHLLLLLPAADLWHGFMVLPAFLPLVAWELSAVVRHAPRRVRALVPACVLVVAIPFVAQLWTVRRAAAGEAFAFEHATGIGRSHPASRDFAALLAYLDAEPRRQRPIFVVTGEAMIYFLAGRVSPVDREEHLVQMIARGVATPDAVALVTDERRLLRTLKAARPLVIDDTRNPARARLARLLPDVDRLLRTRYAPQAAFGSWCVLDRVPRAARPAEAASGGPACRIADPCATLS